MFDGKGVIRAYLPILVRLCLYVGPIAQLLFIQVLGKLDTKDSSKEAKLDRGTKNRWRPTSHREITTSAYGRHVETHHLAILCDATSNIGSPWV